MSMCHNNMYEERTANSMPFLNTKKELILENIIIGFILVLKEFRII
jgi:hypothetical protein